MTSLVNYFESNFDPLVVQLLSDTPSAFVALLVFAAATYLSIYATVKGRLWISCALVVPALMLFWWSINVAAQVRCKSIEAGFRFVIAIVMMKLLDLQMRSLTNSLPRYTSNDQPRPSIVSLMLLTELRYESFTPNPIRHFPLPAYPFPSSPHKRQLFYSEPIQFLIHAVLFTLLQCLPQQILPVKSLGILFGIWLLWTFLERILRYKSSPSLFGPIYLAESLANFWTETWHNALTSPCISLAYNPTTYLLTHLPLPFTLPRKLIRFCAMIATFTMMGAFHVYGMAPILTAEGEKRVGLFFVANGICTVLEVAVWGRKRSWVRGVLAWVIELGLASWTVSVVGVADGLLGADWRGMCIVKT